MELYFLGFLFIYMFVGVLTTNLCRNCLEEDGWINNYTKEEIFVLACFVAAGWPILWVIIGVQGLFKQFLHPFFIGSCSLIKRLFKRKGEVNCR